MNGSKDSTSNRPFLANLAVGRTEISEELPGRYCSQKNVWTVDGRSGPTPIVTNHLQQADGPITKVKGERDEFCASGVLELMTKTKSQLERDDTSPRAACSLPELVTKTEQIRERDDPSPRLLLELSTKTAAVPERDD